MKKVTEPLWKISTGILFLFSLFIGLFLAYYSGKYTFIVPLDYVSPSYITADRIALNLILFILVAIICVLLEHLFSKLRNPRLAGYVFLAVCCVLYVTLCLIWVNALPYYPTGDQLNATACAYYNLEGNYSMFCLGGYIGKYPFQKGLVLLYEVLFSLFGYFCYSTAAKLHIILGIFTMVFGYLFVEETAAKPFCKLLYCPLLLLCAPYLILTPYAYGDLPALCFSTILFWAMLRFSKTFHIRYVVLACVMSSFSLMMRVHTWIALIAVMIGMLLLVLQKKKVLAPIIAGCLVILCAYSTIKVIDWSYEIRSGYRDIPGSPMILHLAMGLQDNPQGPGTFNNYQTLTLETVGYDPVAASAIAREDMRESIDHMLHDRSFTTWFFKTKLQQQWINPSFAMLQSVYSFDANKKVPAWIGEVYFGKYHNPLHRYMDRYQSVIYFGFLCFVLTLIKRRREAAGFYIPLITIVGGFLFSIIWESQCRYVFPYFICMFLYVPDGILTLGNLLRGLCARLLSSLRPSVKL